MIFVSCVPYYKNENGIYIPKYPNYSLKDKKGFLLPKMLDTFNVYKYHGFYEKGLIKLDDNARYLSWFLKFYANGRLLSVSKKELNNESLDPKYSNREYFYYNRKDDIIDVESFVTAEGGQYIVLEYKLSKNGDTLTNISDGEKSFVFIKEKIPKEWKRYKVDW